MHSAALPAKENHDLRVANEKDKHKRKRCRLQVTTNGKLCIQEARDLIQVRNEQEMRLGFIC
jgi:hypothetical protein